MECKKNDCFNCPYPDCINDYVKKTYPRKKQWVEHQTEYVSRRAKRRAAEGLCTKCDIDTHRTPDGGNVTMWNLIPRKLMPPTRLVRYCCAVLKEGGAKNRWIATGVRWAESTKRKSRGVMETIHKDKAKRLILMNDNDESRMLIENCQLKGTRTVNPIIDWPTESIWDYCAAEKICMNPLYACGEDRVGCINCAMAGKRRKFQLARYPKYKAAYIRAYQRMIEERHRRGLPCCWQTGEEVLHWLLEDGVLPGQITFDGMEDTL